MKKIVLILTILSFSITMFGQNAVDWERRVVRATGIGAPNPNAPNVAVARIGAMNAAKMVALADLIGTIKGMYISSESTVENYMTTSQSIKSQVEGIARGYRLVPRKELGETNAKNPYYALYADGSVSVTVEMSIDGDLSALALGGQQFADNGTGNASYDNSTNNVGENVYTGLVIDCSSINLRPALAPKILDQAGNEIYGSANVSKDFAVQQGMMGYLKNIESAKQNSRVGTNPLIVKAVTASGANSVDIVIDNNTAQKIKDLSSKLNFLRECRVIAIIK